MAYIVATLQKIAAKVSRSRFRDTMYSPRSHNFWGRAGVLCLAMEA